MAAAHLTPQPRGPPILQHAFALRFCRTPPLSRAPPPAAPPTDSAYYYNRYNDYCTLDSHPGPQSSCSLFPACPGPARPLSRLPRFRPTLFWLRHLQHPAVLPKSPNPTQYSPISFIPTAHDLPAHLAFRIRDLVPNHLSPPLHIVNQSTDAVTSPFKRLHYSYVPQATSFIDALRCI